MKDEPRPVHQLEHAEPTVIHHPEEDMTILARWLQRGIEKGPRFWLLAGGVFVVLLAVTVIASGLAAGKSASSEAWTELAQAKTVEDRIKIAESHPNTPVSGWAKLLSAQEEYSYGINDLTTPGKKATAGARLEKALKLFREVAKEAPKDSSQALGGMFGAARTLEARNELTEAIEQYRLLASKFPNTPEAKQALALAKALEEPVNVAFYKELYAYKPPATPSTDPIGGPGSPIPSPVSSGSAPGATLKPFLPDLTVPPPGLDAPPPSTTTPPVEAPKPEAPKAEAPKARAEDPKAATPPK
jgi:hypothetical protein